MKKEYSPEILSLRERLRLGNKKLIAAWGQICKMDHESQQWRDELERWHQANETLSNLCSQLKLKGYEDCLYIDSEGKKMIKCGDMNAIGCRVCPSTRGYWIEEIGFV